MAGSDRENAAIAPSTTYTTSQGQARHKGTQHTEVPFIDRDENNDGWVCLYLHMHAQPTFLCMNLWQQSRYLGIYSSRRSRRRRCDQRSRFSRNKPCKPFSPLAMYKLNVQLNVQDCKVTETENDRLLVLFRGASSRAALEMFQPGVPDYFVTSARVAKMEVFEKVGTCSPR